MARVRILDQTLERALYGAIEEVGLALRRKRVGGICSRARSCSLLVWVLLAGSAPALGQPIATEDEPARDRSEASLSGEAAPAVERNLLYLEYASKRALIAAKRAFSAVQRVKAWQRAFVHTDPGRLGLFYEDTDFSGLDLSRSPLAPFDSLRPWLSHADHQGRDWQLEAFFLDTDYVARKERTTFLLGYSDPRSVAYQWRMQETSIGKAAKSSGIQAETLLMHHQAPSQASSGFVPSVSLAAMSEIQALYLLRAAPILETLDSEDEDDPERARSWVLAVLVGKERTLALHFPGFGTDLGLAPGFALEPKTVELSGHNAGATFSYRVRRSKLGLSFEWKYDDCGIPDLESKWERFALLPLRSNRKIPVVPLLDEEDRGLALLNL